MNESNSQSKLDTIAEEFTASIRRGEDPSIESYLEQYPESADQIESLLNSIKSIEQIKGLPKVSAPAQVSLQEIDDYRIVREIGRGGMGVVFEAIHQSLGRRVALKILSADLLGDTRHLTRFRREAKAAARLRHPNIVSVFGVGHSRNQHYYVMDFINGMSLADWLRSVAGGGLMAPTMAQSVANSKADFELDGTLDFAEDEVAIETQPKLPIPDRNDTTEYFRWVAKLTSTVCGALDYAHHQQVLHRDIKPANLLLDEKGSIWIADFGLAKLLEQQGTLTQEIVGTPQYMPPESFDGRYDIRSETYCVGLLLFELLTLRPAVEAKSHQQLIRKAVEGVSVSPKKFNQHIPRDLETIVRKALSFDDKDRYQSAADFQNDLECYLSNRPISARRFSLVERLVRWSHREPVVAKLTFAVFASLLASVIVASTAFINTRNSLKAVKNANAQTAEMLTQRTAALDATQEESLRAERNLELALAAINKVIQRAGEPDIGSDPDDEFGQDFGDSVSPNVTASDAEMLQSLLLFLDELADNNSESLLEQSAEAGKRAGELYHQLGELRKAETAYKDAFRRYENIREQDRENFDSLVAEAEILNERAVIAGKRGRFSASLQFFESSKQLFDSSPKLQNSREGRFLLARANRIQATFGTQASLIDAGVESQEPTSWQKFAIRKHSQQDIALIDDAIDLVKELTNEFPDDVSYLVELARLYRDKSLIGSRLAFPNSTRNRALMRANSAPLDAFQASVEILEKLSRENRESKLIQYEFAQTLFSLPHKNTRARRRLQRAEVLIDNLVAGAPELTHYKNLQARAKEVLAADFANEGLLDEAVKKLEQALSIYNDLMQTAPETRRFHIKTMRVLEALADSNQQLGRTDEAREHLQAAKKLLPKPRLKWLPNIIRSAIARIDQKLAEL